MREFGLYHRDEYLGECPDREYLTVPILTNLASTIWTSLFSLKFNRDRVPVVDDNATKPQGQPANCNAFVIRLTDSSGNIAQQYSFSG